MTRICPLIQKSEKRGKQIDQMQPLLKAKHNEVILGPPFLDYVLEQFNQLFQYLDKAIQVKYSQTSLENSSGQEEKSKVKLP